MNPEGRRIARTIELHMQGDWGIANLHRLLGWLSAGLGARTEPGSRFAIWNGRGGTDAAVNLIEGRVDLAFFVPASMGRTLIEGDAILRSPAKDQLRALGTLPQTDQLVIAVDASLGLRSLADIRAAKPALRIAAAIDDGANMVGFATTRLLEAAGMSRETIKSWGGSFVDGEAPWDTIGHATAGRANAVIFEAVMTRYWKELTASRPMSFIPVDDEVLSALERRDLLPRAQVPAGRFEGPKEAFSTVDFSDFLLLCRDDLPDEIAYLIAACLCETTDTIEAQYRHFAPSDSPVTYPLEPRKIARTSVALHPGARRYYVEKGLIDD